MPVKLCSGNKMQSSSDNIVKVAVKANSKDLLYKLNQDESLENVIKDICEQSEMSYEAKRFALRLKPPVSSSGKYIFISENNRYKIKNGSELRLVLTPFLLARKIQGKLDSKVPENLKWGLRQAAVYTTDLEFCREFFYIGFPGLENLLQELLLTNELFSYALQIILNLIRASYLKKLNDDFLVQLKTIITSTHEIEEGILEKSFEILESIIFACGDSEIVTKILSLDDFTHHIWTRGSPTIQGNAIALINTMVLKCLKAKTQRLILKKMTSTALKDNIYTNVILTESTMPQSLLSALKVYQSLILNLEKERLKITTKTESLLNSLLPYLEAMENINGDIKNKIVAETFGFIKEKERMLTMKVPKHNLSSSISVSSSSFESDEDEIYDTVFTPETYCQTSKKGVLLSQLTFDCLIYLYNNHLENIYKIALSEDGNDYNKFLTTCERVINIICVRVLQIGEIPENGDTAYQFCPIIFNTGVIFLEELFSKTFNVLLKTKREMKAKCASDLEKVFQVLERQLRGALGRQPVSEEQLEAALGAQSYWAVRNQWEEEQERERLALTQSPAVRQLKQSLVVETKELIKKQRIQRIKTKTEFPVWNPQKNERVKNKTWYAFLSSDEKYIQYSNDKEGAKQLAVQSITSLLTGRLCPHVKYPKRDSKARVKKELAFSIKTDQDFTLDFIADTQEDYDYWTDAINVLLGNEMKSTLMKRDLSILLEMELKLRLLDVDGIDLPFEAPLVPLDPPNYDFCSN